MPESGQPSQVSEIQTVSSTSTSLVPMWAAVVPGDAYSDRSIRLGSLSFPTDSSTWTALLAPIEMAGLPEHLHLQIHPSTDTAAPSDLPDNLRAIPEGPASVSVCFAGGSQSQFSCDIKVASWVQGEIGTSLKLDLSNVQCSIPDMNQPRTFDLHIPAGMRSFKSEPLGSAGHAFLCPILDHNRMPTNTMGTAFALMPSSWEAVSALTTALAPPSIPGGVGTVPDDQGV